MDRLEAHGVSIGVPAGWEAELSTQEAPASLGADSAADESPRVVLHAANFPLPADRGDYGSEAAEAMGRGGIFLALIEFDEGSAGSMLFAAEGIPALLPDDFTADQLLRPRQGQAGLQRFFRAGSRPFCLYAVLGSHSMRRLLAPDVNRILSGLAIE